MPGMSPVPTTSAMPSTEPVPGGSSRSRIRGGATAGAVSGSIREAVRRIALSDSGEAAYALALLDRSIAQPIGFLRTIGRSLPRPADVEMPSCKESVRWSQGRKRAPSVVARRLRAGVGYHIAEHWTVPPDVRARRRSKKAGKAPQKVLAGQSKPRARGAGTRGDLARPASSPDSSDHVNLRSA